MEWINVAQDTNKLRVRCKKNISNLFGVSQKL